MRIVSIASCKGCLASNRTTPSESNPVVPPSASVVEPAAEKRRALWQSELWEVGERWATPLLLPAEPLSEIQKERERG